MGRFAVAMEAMRVRLMTLDPSPQKPLVAAYVYPRKPPFSITTLPVGIVERPIHREYPVGSKAAGRGMQRWEMRVDILLADAPLSTEDLIADASVLYEPWLDVMDAMLIANLDLGGTVDMIGSGEQNGVFFVPRETQIRWHNRTYYGIRFQIPVLQTWARASASP